MDHINDKGTPSPLADSREYALALSARRDVFSLEGYRSQRTIGWLVAAFSICAAMGLWLAPRILNGVPRTLLRDITGVESGARGGPAGGLRSDLSGAEIDFYLQAEKSLAPRNAPKPAPSVSAPKKKAARKSLPITATASATANTKPGPSAATPESRSDRTPAGGADWTRQGDQLKKHGDYAGAGERYRHALAQNPSDVNALAGLADLFRYSGSLDSAIRFYRASLAVNGANPKTHDGLGTALYENSVMAMRYKYVKDRNIKDQARYIREQYDSAILEYTHAIDLDSTCVQALANRGVLRAIHNDPNAAIEDYSRAIRIQPANADAFSKRADTYKDVGRLQDAIADYSAAIKLDSGTYEFDPTLHFANAYFGRGTAYYKSGKLDAALADFDSALALSPRHALAALSKGVTLADQKQHESAIAAYSQAIAWLTPTEYDGALMLAYLQRGNSWKALEKYDTALADYGKALESPKLAAKACWRMAQCYCRKEDAKSALAWLEKSKSYRQAEPQKWIRDRELSLLWNMREFKALTAGP